jgi:hypothetical protein
VLLGVPEGQKQVRMSKITVLDRFSADMTLLHTFFSGSSACKVVAHEKLFLVESIGNRVSMFLVVKKHWDHYQVAYDCSKKSEAVPSLGNNR